MYIYICVCVCVCTRTCVNTYALRPDSSNLNAHGASRRTYTHALIHAPRLHMNITAKLLSVVGNYHCSRPIHAQSVHHHRNSCNKSQKLMQYFGICVSSACAAQSIC